MTAEVLPKLKPGQCVTLPDGEQAVVVAESAGYVEVVLPQRLVGKGPFQFHRFQVEPLQ